MKKITIMLVALVTVGFSAGAQEYKLAKSTGRLEIREVNHVTIEGTSGNEIIFSTAGRDHDDDNRAKGLRAVSSLGLEDNTGIGLSVVDKGAAIEVQQLKKMDGPEITIKVPKGVIVSYSHTSPYGDNISIRNFEGEVEVSTVHNGVNLEAVTGPLSIKTVHGDIEASLGANLKSPISLVSVHGHVDVALPVGIKASLKLATIYGEIFVDPDFKLDIEKKGALIAVSSDNLNGKINGGGIDVNLSSTHNSVYLRKK